MKVAAVREIGNEIASIEIVPLDDAARGAMLVLDDVLDVRGPSRYEEYRTLLSEHLALKRRIAAIEIQRENLIEVPRLKGAIETVMAAAAKYGYAPSLKSPLAHLLELATATD
jgi:hypothetical protein